MQTRVLVRCAVASFGALTFFTVALATPAQCRFGMHRPFVESACEPLAEGRQAYAPHNDRAPLIAISIIASGKAAGLPDLGAGRGDGAGRVCLSAQDNRCWSNSLVKACVVRSAVL